MQIFQKDATLTGEKQKEKRVHNRIEETEKKGQKKKVEKKKVNCVNGSISFDKVGESVLNYMKHLASWNNGGEKTAQIGKKVYIDNLFAVRKTFFSPSSIFR